MGRGWSWMLLATLVAVALSGCDSFGNEVAFEVVADTTQPAIVRTGPDGPAGRPPTMPGAEVGMAAVVKRHGDVQTVWDQLGFDQPVVSLPDDQALLVVAGGQPASCPWTIEAVEAGESQSVLVRLGTRSETTGCTRSGWQARAVAMTVPAAALPSTGDQPPIVSLGSDSSLPPSLLPQELRRLDLDSLLWAVDPDVRRGVAREEEGPLDAGLWRHYEDGSPGSQLTADRPLAVTSFPGMDVIHLRFTSRRDSARLSAAYVTDPPAPVAGDSFLRLEVGPTGASPQAMPRHLEAPAQAAITEIVRLPDRRTWIIGLDGSKRPLTTGSHSYDLPQATGSAELIALPHPQSRGVQHELVPVGGLPLGGGVAGVTLGTWFRRLPRPTSARDRCRDHLRQQGQPPHHSLPTSGSAFDARRRVCVPSGSFESRVGRPEQGLAYRRYAPGQERGS